MFAHRAKQKNMIHPTIGNAVACTEKMLVSALFGFPAYSEQHSVEMVER